MKFWMHGLKLWPACWAIFFVLTLNTTLAQPNAQTVRQFRIGSVSTLNDLPVGPFRSRIAELPSPGPQQALKWLSSYHFTEMDLPALRVDARGGVFYVCLGKMLGADTNPPPLSAAALPVSPFPANLIFHSRPGSANVLYINFAGENVTNTAWNTDLGRAVIPAVAFSTDTDPTTFSDAEQVAIKKIWQRMAEDYSPFDIDVTTERPPSLTSRTALALITRTTDAN